MIEFNAEMRNCAKKFLLFSNTLCYIYYSILYIKDDAVWEAF